MDTFVPPTPPYSRRHRHKLSATQSAALSVGTAGVGTDVKGLSGDVKTEFDLEKIAQGIKLILEGIGEDPEREGLQQTPSRVARMYKELVYGLHADAAEEITCTFNEGDSELILIRDISFSSICEHHLVPFIGSAHVGYIPNGGKITGLSKIARVVELVSRRLQVQERMTTQIADAIMKRLDPSGVIVVLEAEHLCMSVRGIRKPGSKTITSALRGIFHSSPAARAEAMALIQGRHAN